MTGLMAGKRGLIMGVANDHSIAWGIAKVLHRARAPSWPSPIRARRSGRRVTPLAASARLGHRAALRRRGSSPASTRCSPPSTQRLPDGLDFVVHAIGFSDKGQLKGRYVDVTTRENFSRTMAISCFSFTEIAQRAAKRMPPGGSLLTLTYGGSTRVMPNYNVMGVAKAALEASVRYLAGDLGPDGIRVNALSAGPMRTLAGAGIADARLMFNHQKAPRAPAPHRDPSTRSAARRCTCSRTSRAASPARSTSSIPATTSSRCPAPTCSRPRTRPGSSATRSRSAPRTGRAGGRAGRGPGSGS